MRPFSLLLWLIPLLCGHQTHSVVSDRGAHVAPRRVPRQLRALPSKETNPYIQELSVKTTIISRYAFTAVSCTMFNKLSAAREGVFRMQIPANAFISNFTMIIAGRVFPSQIKAKEKKAKEQNGTSSPALKENQEKSRESEMEMFQAAAVVPGKNRAVFLLTYEELLARRHGVYKHVTAVRPQQHVGKLSVQVVIVEHSEITHLEVLPLRNGLTPANNSMAHTQGKVAPPVSTVIQQNKTFCNISFTPSIVQQATIAANGVLGDFIVQYDVKRELAIGELQVLDGHFVHYFAPKDLPVVPKNVVFVIDTSASMVGTKMRQTKEALFTILRDLRPNDFFNFVSFSNRMKVWKPGKLVPVTPNNIRDAKKFIYLVSPTGATNINQAIETGSSLLRSHLSSEGSNHSRVSLLIFLTDGRPTVGEVKPPKILHNARLAVQEQFCVFTIGLGDDVDYRLLQQLALDNCGTMRRIPEKADASAMLKGFYDEIGTPLLSDIRIEYSDDAVEYVTQNLFSNYFNGSEIVVAGKLTNQSADSIHVQVTASNSNKSLVLESDVRVREREKETEQRIEEMGLGPLADGYTERVFGYLSVKDSLKSRLRSQSSQEREQSTQQATNLSLTYNFLTPLTTMVVETPSVQVEDPKPDSTVSPSAETSGGTTQNLPVDTKPLVSSAEKPVKELITISKTSGGVQGDAIYSDVRRGSSLNLSSSQDERMVSPVAQFAWFNPTADGDPHFVVEFPLSKLTMCFNINGEPGQVLRLVSDHKHSGVTVNGMLIGAPAPAGAHKQLRTYFSTIAIVVDRPKQAYIEITPQKVVLDGIDQLTLPCNTTAAMEYEELSLAIVEQSNVTITIHGTIIFVVLIHVYKNPAPFQQDHLGFYISNSKGLSEDCHGLLGQFLYQEVTLTQMFGNVTDPMNNRHHRLPRRTLHSEISNNNTVPFPKSSYFRLPSEIAQKKAAAKAAPPNLITLQPELTNFTKQELLTNKRQSKVLTKTEQNNTLTTTTQTVSRKPVQPSNPSKSSRFKRSLKATPAVGPTNTTQPQVLKNITQPKSPPEIRQSNTEKNIKLPDVLKNVTQTSASKTLSSSVLTETKQPIIQKNSMQLHAPKSVEPKILTKTMKSIVLPDNSEPKTLTKVLTNRTPPIIPMKSAQTKVPTNSKQSDIPNKSLNLDVPTKSPQYDLVTWSKQLKVVPKSMRVVVLQNNTQTEVPKTLEVNVLTTSTKHTHHVPKETVLSVAPKNNTRSNTPTKTMQPKALTENTEASVPKKTTQMTIPGKNTQTIVLKNNTLNVVMQPSLTKRQQPSIPKNNMQPIIPTKTMQPTVLQNNTQPNVPVKTTKPIIPKKIMKPTVLQNNTKPNFPAKTTKPIVPTKTMQPMVLQNNTQPNVLAKTTKPIGTTKTMQPTVPQNNTQPNVPAKTTKPIVPTKTMQPTVLQNNTQPNVPAKTTKPIGTTKTMQPTVLQNSTKPNFPAKTTKPIGPSKTMQPTVLQNYVQSKVPAKTTKPIVPAKTMQPTVLQNNTEPNVPAKTTKPIVAAKTMQPTVLQNNMQPNVPAKTTKPIVPTKTMQPTVPQNNTEPNVPAKTTKPIVPTKTMQPTVPQNNTEPNVPAKTTKPIVAAKTMQPTVLQNNMQPNVPAKATKSIIPTKTMQPTVPQNNTQPNVPAKTTKPIGTTKTMQPTVLQNNTQPNIPAKTTKPIVAAKTMQPTVLQNNTKPNVPAKTTKPISTTKTMQPTVLQNYVQSKVPAKTRKPIVPAKTMEPTVLQNNAQPNIPAKTTKSIVPTKTMQPTVLQNNTQPNIPVKTTKPIGTTKTMQPTVLQNNTKPNFPAKTTKPIVPAKTMEPTVLQLNGPAKTTKPIVPTKTMKPTVLQNNAQPNIPAKTTKSIVPTKTMQPTVLQNNTKPNFPAKTTKPIGPPKTMQPTVLQNYVQSKVPAKTTKPIVPAKTMEPTVLQLNGPAKTTKPIVPTKTMKPTVLQNNAQPNIPAKTTKSIVPTKTMQPTVLQNNTKPNFPPKITKPIGPPKTMQPTILQNYVQSKVPAKTMQPTVLQPNGPAKATKSIVPTKTMQPMVLQNNTQTIIQTKTTWSDLTKKTHPNLIKSMQLNVPNGNAQPKISTNTIQSTTSENIVQSKLQRQATKLQASTVAVHFSISGNTTEPKNQQNHESMQPIEPTNVTRPNVSMKTMEPNITQYKVLIKPSQSEILLNVSLPQETTVPEITVNAALDSIQPLFSPGLKIKGRTISVTQKTRKIYGGKETVECWFVKNSASKLIDGQYEDYVVPYLFYTSNEPHGNN